MTTSVVIDRTSLSLGDLTIESEDFTATYLLLLGGLGRPPRTWRLGSVPDSADTHGTVYTTAALEQTSLPLRVMVQADTTVALDDAVAELEAALSQFMYDVTVTVDGVAKTWSAAPAPMSADSGQVEHAMVLQHFDVLMITVPVYPIPGT